MAEELHTQEKKPFYKTWWGILLILFLLPFFLTYWIWKSNWSPKLKYGVIAGMWILFFGISALNSMYEAGYRKAKEEVTAQVASSQTTQAEQAVQPTTPPVETNTQTSPQTPKQEEPTATPTKKPVAKAYDKSRGNNPVAAQFAQKFFDISNNAGAGFITDVYVELSPEDMKGKSEDDYKKSVTLSRMVVTVDPSLWSETGETTQKDLTAQFVNSLNNTFSGSPRVYVSNGIRTVAEGSWSGWSGEPKVTLK